MQWQEGHGQGMCPWSGATSWGTQVTRNGITPALQLWNARSLSEHPVCPDLEYPGIAQGLWGMGSPLVPYLPCLGLLS